LVSWPIGSTGFELTEAPAVTGANWLKVNVTPFVRVMGENKIEKHVVLACVATIKIFQ
jgi:hypothetical protein